MRLNSTQNLLNLIKKNVTGNNFLPVIYLVIILNLIYVGGDLLSTPGDQILVLFKENRWAQ